MNQNDEVSIKDYVDGRFSDLKEMLSEIRRLNEKAIDASVKSTDEYKTLHNGLLRQAERDRQTFVTKDDAEKHYKLNMQRATIIILIVSTIVGAAFEGLKLLLFKK